MMSETNELARRDTMVLEGSVALVVGGYGAIGTTISETLARAGATTIVAGRDGQRARELAASIAVEGNTAEGIDLDACDVGCVRDRISEVAKRLGSIDILVNCIGSNKEQPLLEVTEEAFDEIYTRTLRAGMFLAQAVASEQIRGGSGGSQIHLLSLRAALGIRDRGYSAFCAAKAGLAGLIKQHSTELGPHGISVNGVAPGLVVTRKNSAAMVDRSNFGQAVRNIPMGRLATPSDVANAVAFFSCPHSRFVSGQVLYVDGGQSVTST